MAAAAAVGSHTSVHLHATEVEAELVANIVRGELALTKSKEHTMWLEACRRSYCALLLLCGCQKVHSKC